MFYSSCVPNVCVLKKVSITCVTFTIKRWCFIADYRKIFQHFWLCWTLNIWKCGLTIIIWTSIANEGSMISWQTSQHFIINIFLIAMMTMVTNQWNFQVLLISFRDCWKMNNIRRNNKVRFLFSDNQLFKSFLAY